MNTIPSLHFIRKKAGTWVSLGLLSSSLLTFSSAASANYGIESVFDLDDGSFRECTRQLVRANVEVETATSVCAKSFKPERISTCVAQIAKDSPLAIADILSACQKVRRPLELSSCVVDIRKQLAGAEPADVLGFCRRSLLPRRYARCVVGITADTQLEAAPAMQKCLAAGDYFPAELDPTFIPY